jgi:hypothetical protein
MLAKSSVSHKGGEKASREYLNCYSKRNWEKYISLRHNTHYLGISTTAKSRLIITSSGDISTSGGFNSISASISMGVRPKPVTRAFCKRVMKSELAMHYTEFSPEKLKRVYSNAKLQFKID